MTWSGISVVYNANGLDDATTRLTVGTDGVTLTDTAPVPTGSELEKTDVIDNLISIARIEDDKFNKLAVKTNQEWSAGVKFKVYDPTDLTCFDADLSNGVKGCYAWYGAGEQKTLFLCLGNGHGGQASTSAQTTINPPNSTSVGIPVANGNPGDANVDAYIWVNCGDFLPGSEFADSQIFFELPSVVTGTPATNATAASGGLLHGFTIEDAGTGYTNGLTTATLRYTDLVGAEHTQGIKAYIKNGSVVRMKPNSATTIDSSSGDDSASEDFTLADFQGFGKGGSGNPAGILRASVEINSLSLPTRTAKVRPLFGPSHGYGVTDQLNVFPPFYLGLCYDFEQNLTGDVFTDISFRQVSIIKSPLRAGGTGPTTTGTPSTGTTDTTSGDATDDSNIQTMDSLKSIKFTGSTTGLGLSSGDSTESWYMEKAGQRAWIDKVDDSDSSNQLIYFHQNSSSRQINAYDASSTTNFAGATLDEWGDNATTFKVYDNSNVLKATFTQDGAVKAAEHTEKTGTVLFLENRSGIKRTTAQTEKVRIILQF